MKIDKNIIQRFGFFISLTILFLLLIVFSVYEKKNIGKSNEFLGEVEVKFEKFSSKSFVKYIEDLKVQYPASTVIRSFKCVVDTKGNVMESHIILDSKSYSGYLRSIKYSRETGKTSVESIAENELLSIKNIQNKNLKKSNNNEPKNTVYVLPFAASIDFFLMADKTIDENLKEKAGGFKYDLTVNENDDASLKNSDNKNISIFVLNNGVYNHYSKNSESGNVFLQVSVRDTEAYGDWKLVSEYELELY